jgi:hypothetical protein
MVRTVVVFDIDGVVADVRHRLHFLDSAPKDWSGFFAAAGQDLPLADGIALARAALADHDLVWLTGRPERLRRVTERWLADHGLPRGPLLMRRQRDFRPARVAKREALRELAGSRQIALVVDDDPEVVAALVEDGFAARLADWVPRSATIRSAQEGDGRT